ncbi:MAG TPA: glycosyltransferase family 39 protein [Pyrinomonadaceae bacterium]|nr:glycosyltransferase family 39 protein [Pyrinomonadaceae bacterium]
MTRKLSTPLLLVVFVAIFAALLASHLTLLGLPYYWDEAGYFVPAARDIYADGSFIPHSTLSNAHPPLVMAYLALAWKLFGFHIWVTRAAMLAVAAFALTGVYALAEKLTNRRVALAAVICTAVYPVFFAQSSLAHLDMMVAALTMWALVLYLPRASKGEGKGGPSDAVESRAVRRASCVVLLALAALAKETAVLVPLTLFGWELLCRLAGKKERLAALVCIERRSLWQTAALLLACVPLALWLAYHHAHTGYFFGNPEYFRYNVESTLNLSRVLDTLWRRFGHVTARMNFWALTLAGLAAMLLKPRRDDGGVERPRISVPVQLLFAALVLAHVTALSLVGGAVLARYMLPVLPLVVLVWVSTLWRRVPAWALAVALVCGAFVYRAEVNPTYSFPWEENLAYRDFVLLHRDAAHFLEEKYPGARVLTSWPATDELRNPYFGYLSRPPTVVPVENFLPEELQRAAARKADYDVALLYSTHGGPDLEDAARLLGGRVVFREERKGQWVAVVEK